jgi:hypothetical protein
MNNPSFAYIFRIVVKVYLSLVIILAIMTSILCLIGVLFVAAFWGSFAAWINYLPHLLPFHIQL